jgi:hypothetical protein
MEFIKVFLITQLLFLILQFIHPFKLEPYQYSELVFGSVFIIIFFGFFGSILTLDMMKQEQVVLSNSALIAILYAIWYYLTKKLSNLINSDPNNVIYF